MKHLIEFRSYQLHPGMRQTFAELMQHQSLALLRKHGQQVLLAQASADGSDSYLLVRRYLNLNQRQLAQQAFYSSADWQEGPRNAILACILTSTDCLVELDQTSFALCCQAWSASASQTEL